MFGNAPSPQNEKTVFMPRSPYAVSKLFSYWTTVNYREGYKIFSCNGILFNHESPRRGETFLTRKVTMAITNILANKQKKLFLGNLESKRDWGYAPEYVKAMWEIMQLNEPEDFVIGTGETHSVREFVEKAFSYANLDFTKYVEIDPRYFRPTETEELVADSSEARKKLGWDPKVKFFDLIKIMIDADMRKVSLEPYGEGDAILKKKFPNKWWKVD
jgi:GDPmannose 4,6-dehydratase